MARGNTKGKITNQPASSPNIPTAANPVVNYETAEEKGFFERPWDNTADNVAWLGEKVADGATWVVNNPLEATHLALDVAGLVPGFGEVADGANALIYLAEGDKVNAALSAAAMVPFAGYAATGAKATNKIATGASKGAGKTLDPPKPPPGGKVRGSKRPEGPCDYLRIGKGKGDYRGGAHGKTKNHGDKNKGVDENGKRIIKQESHHTPTDSISPLKRNDGPAVQMEKVDHKGTRSSGNSAKAILYRENLKTLLRQGKWRQVLATEVRDIRRIARGAGNPLKYNEAIKEMLEYAKCLGRHGLF